MAYADVDPVSGHLRAPTANAGGIEQMIRNQSIQVQVVDWIFQKITGKSLIQTIITPITGDWSRIAANGEAWRSVGSAVEAISDNLSANVDTLQQHWTGAASESFGNHIRTVWSGGLKAEAGLAKLIGEGFEVVADVSQQLCQEALDLLEKLVNKLIEAISMLPIPFVGWARAVQLVWDGYRIYQQIMGVIQAIKGIIDAAQQLFDSVGRIRNALEAIPDVRNAGDALDVARRLSGGMDAAEAAARTVQDEVGATRDGFGQSATVGSGGSTSGGGGSW